MTRAFVERIKNRYGESSPIYQSRVEGEFPVESSSGMFRRDLLDASTTADVPRAGETRRGARSCALRIGFERPGDTEGAAASRIEEWRRLSTTETATKAAGFLHDAGFRPRGEPTGVSGRYPNTVQYDRDAVGTIVVDSVGIGSGVTRRMSGPTEHSVRTAVRTLLDGWDQAVAARPIYFRARRILTSEQEARDRPTPLRVTAEHRSVPKPSMTCLRPEVAARLCFAAVGACPGVPLQLAAFTTAVCAPQMIEEICLHGDGKRLRVAKAPYGWEAWIDFAIIGRGPTVHAAVEALWRKVKDGD